jgi:hypothetical protein
VSRHASFPPRRSHRLAGPRQSFRRQRLPAGGEPLTGLRIPPGKHRAREIPGRDLPANKCATFSARACLTGYGPPELRSLPAAGASVQGPRRSADGDQRPARPGKGGWKDQEANDGLVHEVTQVPARGDSQRHCNRILISRRIRWRSRPSSTKPEGCPTPRHFYAKKRSPAHAYSCELWHWYFQCPG